MSQITGPGSGSTLEPGFYTVQFLAIDAADNTDTCEFVIHVNDTQVPTIACPSNTISVISGCRCLHLDKSDEFNFTNDNDGQLSVCNYV